MLNEYRNYLISAGQSDSTIHQRMVQLNRLSRFLNGDLAKATEQDLDRFMATELRAASPNYRKSVRSALRGFYAWATKRGHIAKDPAYQMPSVRIPRPLPRPVPEDILSEAYANASVEVQTMILLGAMGGLRLSEITHLHMADREIDVLRVKGKGGKYRIIPINHTLAEALDRMEAIRPFGYYFINPATNSPWSISYVGKHIRTLLPPKYAAHSLRHRAASVAYGATKDIRAVQELLGHASVATTQLYTAITSDDLKAVADATDWKMAA